MSSRKRPVRRTFDKAFYERYYESPATAVVNAVEIQRLTKFILSYLTFLEIDVATVLDVGCGLGMWKRTLRKSAPRVEYTGIEVSEYLCDRFGWHHSSITKFRSRRKYDLVICQDVLQYLNRNEVVEAVERISRLCREALYVDVPTKEDFGGGTLDLMKSDRNVHVRSVTWYRRLLEEYFTNAGGGLFISKRSRTRLLAMERASRQ